MTDIRFSPAANTFWLGERTRRSPSTGDHQCDMVLSQLAPLGAFAFGNLFSFALWTSVDAAPSHSVLHRAYSYGLLLVLFIGASGYVFLKQKGKGQSPQVVGKGGSKATKFKSKGDPQISVKKRVKRKSFHRIAPIKPQHRSCPNGDMGAPCTPVVPLKPAIHSTSTPQSTASTLPVTPTTDIESSSDHENDLPERDESGRDPRKPFVPLAEDYDTRQPIPELDVHFAHIFYDMNTPDIGGGNLIRLRAMESSTFPEDELKRAFGSLEDVLHESAACDRKLAALYDIRGFSVRMGITTGYCLLILSVLSWDSSRADGKGSDVSASSWLGVISIRISSTKTSTQSRS